MKLKVKDREAFIIHQALRARLAMLKNVATHNGKLKTRIQTTEALIERLFPASVIILDEEEI
jgi:hypothetical protein